MTKAKDLLLPAMGLLPLTAGAQTQQSTDTNDGQATNRPNIIYIMCDDMGYADLGCYGQKRIDTPNLDRMAEEGMRFTQAYAGSPVSAPSRASFMTGQHTGHVHVRGNREYWGSSYRNSVFGDCGDYTIIGQEPYLMTHPIIPEIMKENGYATGMFGKWAAGYYNMDYPDTYILDANGNSDTSKSATSSSSSLPNKRGIDCYYGYICQFQAHTYYPNFLNRYDPEKYGDEHVVVDVLEQNIQHAAVSSGNTDYENREQYTSDLIHQYALDWIDRRAEEPDTPFFGIFTYTLPHAELWQPNDSLVAKYTERFEGQDSNFGGNFGSWYYLNYGRHAQFAAMVERLDIQVGQIFAKLEEKGLADNTLVIFTSDNGPHQEGGADPAWFNQEALLQGTKRSTHEGGIRVPFIAKGPGVPAGTVNDHQLAFYDLMPTLLDYAGLDGSQYSLSNSGEEHCYDGISFKETLTGNDEVQEKHEFLYWEFHETNMMALRKGDWKLVVQNGSPRLYDLATDLHEDNNIAAKYPDVVKEMIEIIHEQHTESSMFQVTLPAIPEEVPDPELTFVRDGQNVTVTPNNSRFNAEFVSITGGATSFKATTGTYLTNEVLCPNVNANTNPSPIVMTFKLSGFATLNSIGLTVLGLNNGGNYQNADQHNRTWEIACAVSNTQDGTPTEIATFEQNLTNSSGGEAKFDLAKELEHAVKVSSEGTYLTLTLTPKTTTGCFFGLSAISLTGNLYAPVQTGTRIDDSSYDNRKISALSLPSALSETNSTTLTHEGHGLQYIDLTKTDTMRVVAGESVTPTVTLSGGNWIHAYTYVDIDGDGFTAGLADNGYSPTGDLMTYSCYSINTSTWYNSAGAVSSNNTLVMPAFTAPTTPGTYRMRFKTDWNNIMPDGSADTGSGQDQFYSAGGTIVDVTLEVKERIGILDLQELTNSNAYTLQAERSPLMYCIDEGMTTKLSSGLVNNTTANKNDINQQFLILRTEDTPEGAYYLYSVGAQKFVGQNLTFTATPAPVLSFETYTGNKSVIYPWWVKIDGKYVITAANGTDGNALYHIAGGDDDDGKRFIIIDAGTYDASAVLAQIETTEKRQELKVLIAQTQALVDECYDYYATEVGLQTTKGEDYYIWCNAPQNGSLVNNLLDNTASTFFHSNWQSTTAPEDGLDHHLTVELGENAVSLFKFHYQARTGSNLGDYPTTIKVQGSVNGADYTDIATVTPRNASGGTIENGGEWTSEVLGDKNKAYNYLRFMVTATTSNRNADGHIYWHMAEFDLMPRSTEPANNYPDFTFVSAAATAATEGIATAEEAVANNTLTAEEYEISIAALQTKHDELAAAIASGTLPVLLSLNADKPYVYKIGIGRTDYTESILQYDYANTKMVAVANYDAANMNQGWYFTKGSADGKVFIHPYLGGGDVLSAKSTSNAHSTVWAAPVGEETHQEWTLPVVNTANGTYNIKAGDGSNYFSNNGGYTKNMGFWSDENTTDGGSLFTFARIEFDGDMWKNNLEQYKTTFCTKESYADGNTLGYYQGGAAYNEAHATAVAILASEEATTADYKDAYTALRGANEAVVFLVPETGKFYRLKGKASGNYMNALVSTPDADTKMDMASAVNRDAAGSVFYLTGNSKLLSYKLGTYLKNTHNIGAMGEANGNTIYFNPSESNNGGYFTLKTDYSSSKYIYDNTDKVDRNGSYKANNCEWVIEEITTLPVTIGTVGYATLNAPVALSILENVKAYTGTLNGEWLTLNEVSTTIPANTPVILEATETLETATVFEFPVAAEATAISENALSGTIAAEATSGTLYTLQSNGEGGVVFKKYTGTNLGGFRAHLVLPEATAAQAIRIRKGNEVNGDGGTTGIDGSVLEVQGSQHIYDLMGRKVTTMKQGGIYIVNGKKVVK